MGIKGGHRNNNYGFGNLTNLRRVTPASVEAEEEDTDTIPNTKILRISNEMYEKFVLHSRKFYNVEPYNTILENLLMNFEQNHKDKNWRDMDRQ